MHEYMKSPLENPKVIFRLEVANVTEIYYGYKRKDLVEQQNNVPSTNSSMVFEKAYDYGGAMYFAVAVILLYGISIAFLIGTTLRKSRQDDEVKGFLRSYAQLDDRKYEKQRVRKALREKNLMALVSQTSRVAAAAGAGAIISSRTGAIMKIQNIQKYPYFDQSDRSREQNGSELNIVKEETETTFVLEDGPPVVVGMDNVDPDYDLNGDVDPDYDLNGDVSIDFVSNDCLEEQLDKTLSSDIETDNISLRSESDYKSCVPNLSTDDMLNGSTHGLLGDLDSGSCPTNPKGEGIVYDDFCDVDVVNRIPPKRAKLAKPESLDYDCEILDPCRLLCKQPKKLHVDCKNKFIPIESTGKAKSSINPLAHTFVSLEDDEDYLDSPLDPNASFENLSATEDCFPES